MTLQRIQDAPLIIEYFDSNQVRILSNAEFPAGNGPPARHEAQRYMDTKVNHSRAMRPVTGTISILIF